MSTHKLLHGRNLIIKANDEPLALSKTCTIDVQVNTVPVSGPTTGEWEDSIVGRKRWEVACSHLMYNRGATKPLDRMDMVGQIVTLSMDILYENTAKFNGFVENETIETGSVVVNPDFAWIFYDTANKVFIVYENFKYYRTWTYTDGRFNPFAYANVNDDRIYENIDAGGNVGEYYKAIKDSQQQNYTLTRRDTTRQGSSIVRQWTGTFTWGSLAQGNFKFQGKGPLAPLDNTAEDEEEEEES